MKHDPEEGRRRWLRAKLAPRGAKKDLADYLDLSQDKITRMISTEGERREVATEEWLKIGEYFKEPPPGLALKIPSDIRSEDVAAGYDRSEVAPAVAGYRGIPHVAWVSAGKLADVDAPVSHRKLLQVWAGDLGIGEYFATTVDGDSMDRISPDGSTIIVNRSDKQLVTGRYYVFSLRGKTTYKQFQGGSPAMLLPFSTNPSHKPQIIARKSDMVVVGRVRRTILDL